MGIVVDIGEVKRHIRPKADSTLFNMRKADLIEYIRILEHNYNVGATFLENQAKYIESLGVVEVVRCKDCKHWCYEYDCVGLCTVDVPDIDGVQREDFDFCSYGERRTDGR